MATAINEARLFTEEVLATTREATPFGLGSVFVFTRRSPDKDGPNEDAAGLIPGGSEDRGLLVVADGVGGQRAGAQASGLAISALATAVRDADDGNLRSAVLDAADTANQEVISWGIGAGTTLAVIELHGRTVRPYHVGDSMILIVGQRGRIKLLNVAHSPTGYLVEAGFLDQDEALHHEERHLVSNILGRPDMRVEVGSALELAERDTVVIASDGLSDNLMIEEIVQIVRKGPLQQAGLRLAAQCQDRMGGTDSKGTPSKPDDLTFILFRLNGVRGQRPAPDAS